MNERTLRVLSRLMEVGFQSREGGVSPFGEELPLVSGVAWDSSTAQVAFVAEASGPLDEEAWRQLLFAASGLRHHLASDRPPAFGTPLIVAIVDDEGQRTLRGLVEELTSNYAVFSRVDLNLVRHRDLEDDDALDTALAPLLPSCRGALGTTISRPDVARFWQALRDSIAVAASDLPVVFGEHRIEAARDLADQLIGASEDDDELPPLSPVRSIGFRNFRSFVEDEVSFAPATIVHGTNGSGKSSVLEALELLWSGTTQRRPAGVSADEYQRHLPYRGQGDFVVHGLTEESDASLEVNSVGERPTAEIARNVLTQEAVAGLVDGTPAERYAALLTITGLEVPDLDPRTRQLLTQSKQEADDALIEAGLPPIPAANRDGLRHLTEALGGEFATRVPQSEDLAAAERALADAAEGLYTPSAWSDDADVITLLSRVDEILAGVASQLTESGELSGLIGSAARALRELASSRRARARTLRRVVDGMSAVGEAVPGPPDSGEEAVPRVLAVRWLTHADSLASAAAGFRSEAADLSDAEWAERLQTYAQALDAAADAVPREDLHRFATASLPLQPHAEVTVTNEQFSAAGFARRPPNPETLFVHVSELHSHLQHHADALDALGAELERHPGVKFGERAARVLRTVCRFELARNIRRQGPVMRASEELLRELLEGRLYPVVRELVASIVRFEWYFEPLRLSVEGRQVIIGGLATPRSDLDARMLLNSAERTVVGLAWFLALQLLQPAGRRRVLVLDDPAAAFDAVNRAGFTATLRAFVRLTRPEQLVIATHDDAVAALLAEELSPVGGWPRAVTRVRCRRNADDESVTQVELFTTDSGNLAEEEAMLGLPGGDPSLFVQ
jgi:energy-coupling factor transporter ATP-binding protein EcfA2